MKKTLVTVSGKKPEDIDIVTNKIELENWGFAGMLTGEYRTTNNTELK